MPLMDEFKEERESIKNQPFKKKLEYFWTYYKWWVISAAAVIIILVSVISHIIKTKDELVYVAMVDVIENPAGNIEDQITVPFLTAHDINPKKNTLMFNTEFMFSQAGLNSEKPSEGSPSYANTQGFSERETLAVYIAAGDVDAICGSDMWFDHYAYNDFFIPVSDYMTQEEINLYSDHLYYVDGAVVERYRQARKDGDYEYEEEFPDPAKPEEMEDPVPMGISIESLDLYNNNFLTANGDAKHIVIGIVRNSENTELTAELIKYMENGGN